MKETHCSFTFMITQSIEMNISIGITDKDDRNRNGQGSIYFNTKSGIFENGKQINCHFVQSFENLEEELEKDHKVAYYSLDNPGFKVKDIICT